jgi:hypothetical protein
MNTAPTSITKSMVHFSDLYSFAASLQALIIGNMKEDINRVRPKWAGKTAPILGLGLVVLPFWSLIGTDFVVMVDLGVAELSLVDDKGRKSEST